MARFLSFIRFEKLMKRVKIVYDIAKRGVQMYKTDRRIISTKF